MKTQFKTQADRRRRERWEKTTPHAERAELCAKHRVTNSGRQGRKLRKRLGLTTHIRRTGGKRA